MSLRALQVLVIVCVMYIAAQMLADLGALRILSIAGLSVGGGTLIYPFTFTLRDMVHKVANASIARVLIFSSAAINLFMALMFWVIASLPPDLGVGEQAEFGIVMVPVFRITLASIFAEVVAELLDTEIYELWVRRFSQRFQWGRVLVSNAISVPVDTALFVIAAFWGLYDPQIVFSLFISNISVKYAIAFLSIPGIYLVKEQPKGWLQDEKEPGSWLPRRWRKTK